DADDPEAPGPRAMRGKAGLTLLELLIALTLLAMIGAALARSTELGVQVWRRAETFPAVDQSVVLRAHLRRWIEEMKPHEVSIGARQEVVGSDKSLRFVTSSWIGFPKAEPETRVTLEIIANAEDTASLKITLEALARDGSVSHREERYLIEQAKSIRLRYFHRQSATGGSEGWQDSWASGGRLPTLIALHVTPGEGQDVWPPLIVAPKLD
ncbi:MAG: prepilin-type N-terminal cleavage/methylation domain-containing protein, partial [Pseudomonadota bacterium]